MERIAGASPRALARITGVVYLITMVGGIIAQGLVADRLVVWDDAAATATNILTHKRLFEWGYTLYLVEMAFQVAMTALFYVLLEPVNRTVSLVAAFLSLVGCAIKTFGRLFYLAPLMVLGGAEYLGVFSPEQLRVLALLSLRVNERAAAIGLAFFGLYAVLTGYLMFRSTFLPRILGVISMVAGLGWMTFLSPTLGYRLFPIVVVFGLLGAVSLIVWLLVFGVNEQRWHERAGAAGGSGA
jgi:hypothetical protein